jgi:hypothetical protein
MTRAAGRRRQRNNQSRTLNRTCWQPNRPPRCGHVYTVPVARDLLLNLEPMLCGELEDAEIHYVGTVDSHPFVPEKKP